MTNAGGLVNPNGPNGANPIPGLITSLVGSTNVAVVNGPPANGSPFGPLQNTLASLGLGNNPLGSVSTLLGGTPLAGLSSALGGTPLSALTSGTGGSPLGSLTSLLGGTPLKFADFDVGTDWVGWAARVAHRIRCRR